MQLPAGWDESALDRVAQCQQPEVVHVARRVGLGPRVEEQPAAPPRLELGSHRRVDRRDRVLERRGCRVALRHALRIDAEPVPAKVLAQELGREECPMGEPVGLARHCRQRPHGIGERLVLLDQIEKPPSSDQAHRLVSDVGAPPGAGDEAVRAADLDTARLAAELHLDPIEKTGEAAVCLDLPAPAARQGWHAIDRQDPHAQAALREAASQVQLGDVAAEEVLEVDRRDEDVDTHRRNVRDGELEGRGLLHDLSRSRCGRARAQALGSEIRGRRRVEPQVPARALAGGGRQGTTPRECVGELHLGPDGRSAPDKLGQSALPQVHGQRNRSVRAQEPLQHTSLVCRHCRAAALLEDRRD